MGIKNLSKLIADHAPGCVKDNVLKNYFGRKVAIDASMSLYQFLIAIRQDGNVLMNEDGEVTSHLNGMFYRTIRLIENGIKPIWVFDGKPPDMKSKELAKRKEKRDAADKDLEVAKESGDAEAVQKFEKRLVKVTREHVMEAQQLLRLMGMPVVEAAGEAEAQCVALVKAGKAFAVATEDMDALTFGTPLLLRNLTAPEVKKLPVREYHFTRLMEELAMSHDQFIDLCILLGCDYCETIRGIGPKRAIELIREHGTIEKIIDMLKSGGGKFEVPENWSYKEARRLFQHAEVTAADEIDLKWNDPQEDAVVDFLCKQKGFDENRVRKAVEKLRKTRAVKTQGRLDDFFKPVAKPATASLESGGSSVAPANDNVAKKEETNRKVTLDKPKKTATTKRKGAASPRKSAVAVKKSKITK